MAFALYRLLTNENGRKLVYRLQCPVDLYTKTEKMNNIIYKRFDTQGQM